MKIFVPNNYENVCKQKVDDYDRLENSQKQFCMKLVRNLACYNYEDGYYNLNNEECMILYYWIYSSVKQHNINNNLITPIFYDNYSRFCTYERKANCFYNLYYDYFEDPVGMIFLDIFQQNINTVINMLGNTDVRINANLQKYICECINIYNEMNKTYCLSDVYNDEKRTWTCSRLAAVKLTYDAYLAGKLYKNYVIPVLGRNEGEYLEMCPQDSPGSKLTTEKHRTVSLPSLNEFMFKMQQNLYIQRKLLMKNQIFLPRLMNFMALIVLARQVLQKPLIPWLMKIIAQVVLSGQVQQQLLLR
ncbi:hypothetical protein PCYB_004010 [Plasmodium cynomolgi strain B]|uniref:Uncharacterized protein n=1 Tax=Plasmodium cynomolgi (strain B) TaxID=1120755 RepID=K6VJQ9_PLACD|nr:hypothetical protein PCYB_004010 [Plasmodium cynomolgi strain B]GAB69652.1 hypothetical protein PCYB_004010 [Plasmodium cynomolgi strain B]